MMIIVVLYFCVNGLSSVYTALGYVHPRITIKHPAMKKVALLYLFIFLPLVALCWIEHLLGRKPRIKLFLVRPKGFEHARIQEGSAVLN
jgi:hypothetical protein